MTSKSGNTATGRSVLGAAVAAGLFAATPLAALLALPASAAEPADTAVVINEAYVNGGSRNAPYTHKFVELFNTTDSPVSLDGMSLQYRSATGIKNPNGVVPLRGTIPANGYFLVEGGSNADNGVALPEPDISSGALNPAGASGTIVLADQPGTLDGLATGSVTDDTRVLDLLGYGSSNTFDAVSVWTSSPRLKISRSTSSPAMCASTRSSTCE